ncbi:hypothetical protein DM43_5409 [Burkholderia cepacia]|uniref:Uncharacterized protein n=1 Tax=Burkholderia cepacia TaxID=292 RepID=A0AA88Z651_BURCE|nr:hypothetical protein DM43_5409 [Burkholderia cepacia]
MSECVSVSERAVDRAADPSTPARARLPVANLLALATAGFITMRDRSVAGRPAAADGAPTCA